jgi:hypothetical protein
MILEHTTHTDHPIIDPDVFQSDHVESRRLVTAIRDDPPISTNSPVYSQTQREIQDLQASIIQTRYQLSLLIGEYSRRAWQIAPIRRLPFELIAKIFCAFVENSHDPSIDGSLLQALFLTCRSWREVALATPQIWSRVCIDFRLWSLNASPERLEARLDRTGNASLRVKVYSHFL